MDHRFEDLFDIPKLTELCQSFTDLNGVVTALLDLEGTVHIQTGWQQICTHFHRVNPASAKRCHESDTALANGLAAGEPYNMYQCANGLVDLAIPVHVAGEHVANFFTGQFFLKTPERSLFEQQGERFGYDLASYLTALDKVPIFEEAEIRAMADFLARLATVFGEMGKARLDILASRERERRQLEELEEAHRALEKLATEDALTGLKNRRALTTALDDELHRATRYGRGLTVAMIDADMFKEVNDTFGHATGDHVLREVSRLLASSVRHNDLVARIGGDEFCVLFPETTLEDAARVLDQICAHIAALKFDFEGQRFSVSCSFGVATFDDDHKTPTLLLAAADRALYEAKSHGRNRVVCA